MTNEMEKDLQEAMKKHLPNELGGLLKARLEEADSLEKSLKKTRDELAKADKTIVELDRKIAVYIKQEKDVEATRALNKKTSTEIAERESYITKRENEQELVLLRTKLEMTQDANDKVENLVQTVFRNNTIRETVIKNINVSGGNFPAGTDQYGAPVSGWHDPKNIIDSTETTKTEGPED